MIEIYGICKECNGPVSVQCDGDNPLICPDCRAIDSIDSDITLEQWEGNYVE